MKQLTDSEKQDALIISFKWHRNIIGAIGILLGPILAFTAWVFGECQGLQMSISEYYHTPVGDVFVGCLFAVGFFLFGYKGYNFKEDKWYHRDRPFSIIAGICAIGVAIFPTSIDTAAPDCTLDVVTSDTLATVHYISAAILFLTLAYFSLFLFTLSAKNKPKLTDHQKAQYRIFKICGYVIIACILLIFLFSKFEESLECPCLVKWPPVFFLETLALIAFGISWTTKGELMDAVKEGVASMLNR